MDIKTNEWQVEWHKQNVKKVPNYLIHAKGKVLLHKGSMVITL